MACCIHVGISLAQVANPQLGSMSAAREVFDDVLMYRSAFTPGECNRIEKLFLDELIVARDARRFDNLPHMANDYSVERTNRFDHEHTLMKPLTWVYDRIVRLMGAETAWSRDFFAPGLAPSTGVELQRHVQLQLMHEFTEQDRFGWHVDTRPDLDPGRTYNINIMLSPRGQYDGGELQVGSNNVSAQQGDLYIYAASAPHVVHALSSGLRRVLVLILHDITEQELAKNAELDLDRQKVWRTDYWARTQARFERLATGALAREPKLHMVFGEFLEGAGDAAAARDRFCQSYRADAALAPAYARRFADDGLRTLREASEPVDLERGAQYLEMSACVHASQEVLEALELLQDAVPREGEGPPGEPPSGRGHVHVVSQ